MKILSLFILSFLIISSSSFAVALFAGGTGTEIDPYLVATAEHLSNIGPTNWGDGVYYKQIATIDLNVAPYNTGEGWLPISDYAYGFIGNYDGQNYKILNLYINRPDTEIVGLFGKVYRPSSLKNIHFAGGSVTGKSYAGALAGRACARIDNCTSSVNVTTTANTSNFSYAGGLVGEIYWVQGWTTNCYATGDVIGTGQFIGGLCGALSDGATLEISFATGNVTGSDNVGGLSGYVNSGPGAPSYVQYCFATGDVTASGNQSGGLVGYLTGSYLYDSYATGKVNGTVNVGSVVGFTDWSQIHRTYGTGLVNNATADNYVYAFTGNLYYSSAYDCYNDSMSTGLTQPFDGITPLDSNQMAKQSNFANWDFTTVWQIDEGRSYPYFRPPYAVQDPRPLPPNVKDFTAVYSGNAVELSWTNPEYRNFKGVVIRYSYNDFPASLEDGTQLLIRDGIIGEAETATHSDVNASKMLYYSVWIYDNQETPMYFGPAYGFVFTGDVPRKALEQQISIERGDSRKSKMKYYKDSYFKL